MGWWLCGAAFGVGGLEEGGGGELFVGLNSGMILDISCLEEVKIASLKEHLYLLRSLLVTSLIYNTLLIKSDRGGIKRTKPENKSLWSKESLRLVSLNRSPNSLKLLSIKDNVNSL